MEPNVNLHQRIEQCCHEHTEVLLDSDNEEEYTTSGISENDEDEEEQNLSTDNHFQEGNILHRTTLNQLLNTTQQGHVTFIQAQGVIRTTSANNDQMLEQTMAVLAGKHRHIRPTNSPANESEILVFIGPCPLYSLASSFGLDMHHGLSNFPCRHILAGGGGHLMTSPLWQHLTSFHNLNFSSSSLVISHLVLHGYSIPTPPLFNINNFKSILRTTPRYTLIKTCPLTRYGVYGVRFEHGTRLCSGYTFNTNIYSHLISFHKMTDDASLRLSRSIAFHDKQFQFHSNETIVKEPIRRSSWRKISSIRKDCRKKIPVKKVFQLI